MLYERTQIAVKARTFTILTSNERIITPELQLNPDFWNLQEKRKLFRKIGYFEKSGLLVSPCVYLNRPFLNYLRPLFRSESWCSSFHMQINFHSHENEFNLRENENWFVYERMSTKTLFEKEAWGNSEMAYCANCTSCFHNWRMEWDE